MRTHTCIHNFYRSSASKEAIQKALIQEVHLFMCMCRAPGGVIVFQAEGLIGSPMTYSLFEVAKERAEELIVELPDDMAASSAPVSPCIVAISASKLAYQRNLPEKRLSQRK